MAKTASELARDHTERAVETINEIMSDGFEEARDRLRAAEILLDRGHGKAAQAIIAIPASRQLQRALAGKTDDELLQLVNDAPLPRLLGGNDPIDAEYMEIPVKDPLLE